MNRKWLFLLPLVAAFTFVSARGDEIIFKNGDKLTGKIGSLDGGKLSINSKVAGDIKVDLKDVQTFSTDGPIEIRLADGNVINQKVTAGNAGSVNLAPGGAIQPQPVAIDAMKKINPPHDVWTGALVAGGLLTRGNSDTDAANLTLDLVRRGEKDRITLDAGYFYARQKDPNTGDKTTTTDNWTVAAKYDYFLSEKWYLYADAVVGKDRIAEVNLRFIPGAGVGYQWVERDDFKFNTEAGVSWFYEDFSNDGTEEHAALRLAYHLNKKFNDKVTLFHDVEFYPDLEKFSEYFLTLDAGIRATLTKTMFTEFKFQWDRNTQPAPGSHENDLRYSVGIGWTL